MGGRLWKRALKDLCARSTHGAPDPIIWEHSCRVARSMPAIVALPEFAGGTLDLSALEAAGLYHDYGWLLQLHGGAVKPSELLLKPTPDHFREQAADWVAHHLRDLLPASSLDIAVRAIRYLNDRRTEVLEAQVLADADHLDEIGPQTFCQMYRRCLADGKGLHDLLRAWQKQEEYHYWQTRIEAFRFPSVRNLAQRRWEELSAFMQALRRSLELADLPGAAEPVEAARLTD